jgi:integrase/recombinase XerC
LFRSDMPLLATSVLTRVDGSAERTVSLPVVVPHAHPGIDSAAVIGMIADELSEDSRRKYTQALADLARFLGVATPADALTRLALADPIERHRLAYAWRADLHGRGLSAATVAVRVAALRAAWDRVLRVGLATGPLKVKGPRPTRLKDPTGPDVTTIRAMLDAAASQPGLQGLRDVAILGVLATMGLRRAEAASMFVGHFDRGRSRLEIVGKGRDDSEWVTVPPHVCAAIGAYLDARAATPGEPLFARTDRAAGSNAAPLRGGGIWSIVVRLAGRAGVVGRVTPHGFRHSTITMALDGTSGDVRRVAKLSRHAKLDTVLRYDDARRDDAGELASMIATAIGSERLQGGRRDTPPGNDADGASQCISESLGMGVSVTKRAGSRTKGFPE